MNLKTKYAHESNFIKSRTKLIQYIVIHYTANNGDTAAGNGNYFSQPNRNASAHYFVDEDSVVQSVKDTDTAWHCGTSGTYYHKTCRNANSIGVEMCSEKDTNGMYYINEPTIANTIELVQILMKKHSIPLENVIRHYDVTHKICPEPFVRVPDSWKRFKERLKGEEKKLTVEEAKKVIQEKCGFDENTMNCFTYYRYADSMLIRLAENMK